MSGKSPPNIDGMTSLKVGNISYRTRTLDLHHIFGKFGDVGDVYIPRDKHSKHSRGFAFVSFYAFLLHVFGLFICSAKSSAVTDVMALLIIVNFYLLGNFQK